MTAPSYKGETALAECPNCGKIKEIPANYFQPRLDGTHKGHCSTEDECEKQVVWEYVE